MRIDLLLEIYRKSEKYFPSGGKERPLPNFRARREALDEVHTPHVSLVKIYRPKRFEPAEKEEDEKLERRTKKFKQ